MSHKAKTGLVIVTEGCKHSAKYIWKLVYEMMNPF